MNASSLGLSLTVFLIFAGMTALVWWGAGKHAHWSNRKRKIVCGLFLVGAVIFSLFAYLTDSHQRAVTLFEKRFDWEGGKPMAWEFSVEHPGTVHHLSLTPLLRPLKKANSPVTLRVSIEPREGGSLLEESIVFNLTKEITGKNAPTRQTWESHDRDFQPTSAGIHILRIEAEGVHPSILFIRIEDPLKTDGQRAPGY